MARLVFPVARVYHNPFINDKMMLCATRPYHNLFAVRTVEILSVIILVKRFHMIGLF